MKLSIWVQYNQQRIKLASEQVKEILVLLDHYKTGQGTRTDLTSINVDRSSTRSKVAANLGISYGNIYKLLFILEKCPELMDHIDAGRMPSTRLIWKPNGKSASNR
jgi:hypothetical protein